MRIEQKYKRLHEAVVELVGANGRDNWEQMRRVLAVYAAAADPDIAATCDMLGVLIELDTPTELPNIDDVADAVNVWDARTFGNTPGPYLDVCEDRTIVIDGTLTCEQLLQLAAIVETGKTPE